MWRKPWTWADPGQQPWRQSSSTSPGISSKIGRCHFTWIQEWDQAREGSTCDWSCWTLPRMASTSVSTTDSGGDYPLSDHQGDLCQQRWAGAWEWGHGGGACLTWTWFRTRTLSRMPSTSRTRTSCSTSSWSSCTSWCRIWRPTS